MFFSLQTAIALDFGSSEPGSVRATRVTFQGNGAVKLASTPLQLRDVCPSLPKGLLDKNATASDLFDAFSSVVKTACEVRRCVVKRHFIVLFLNSLYSKTLLKMTLCLLDFLSRSHCNNA